MVCHLYHLQLFSLPNKYVIYHCLNPFAPNMVCSQNPEWTHLSANRKRFISPIRHIYPFATSFSTFRTLSTSSFETFITIADVHFSCFLISTHECSFLTNTASETIRFHYFFTVTDFFYTTS